MMSAVWLTGGGCLGNLDFSFYTENLLKVLQLKILKVTLRFAKRCMKVYQLILYNHWKHRP